MLKDLVEKAGMLFLAVCAGVVIGWSITDWWLSGELEDLQNKLKNQKTKIEYVNKIVVEQVEVEKVVYKDKIKRIEKLVPEIIERPVYKNICLDEDGVSAFNTYMGN